MKSQDLPRQDLRMGVAESQGFSAVCELSYEGFEEARRNQNDLVRSPNSLSKSMNRGNPELKIFSCSINYDLKGGYSSRGRGKMSGSSCFL
jgi:hypothetical protein